MTYYEQLKDPRWDKFCLDLIQERGWHCCHCRKETRKLQVHHGAYLKGVELWDYPPDMLHVLCAECHEKTTGHIQTFMRWFGTIKPVEVFLISDVLPDFHEAFKCPHYSAIFPIMEIILGKCCNDDVQEVGDDVIARINESIRKDREAKGYFRCWDDAIIGKLKLPPQTPPKTATDSDTDTEL